MNAIIRKVITAPITLAAVAGVALVGATAYFTQGASSVPDNLSTTAVGLGLVVLVAVGTIGPRRLFNLG